MNKLAINALLLLATCLSSITSANAALEGRLAATAGGSDYQAYYDTTLNITWLTNANLAVSNQFGLTLSNNAVDLRNDVVSNDGSMTWAATNLWLSNLNSANYLGFNNWRLPTLGRDLVFGNLASSFDVGSCSSAKFDGTSNCGWNVLATDPSSGTAANDLSNLTVYSEIASLYFDTLGNQSVFDTDGNVIKSNGNLENAGPLTNIQHANTPDRYWLGVADATTNRVWSFAFGPGLQQTVQQNLSLNAMLVMDGDVAKLNPTSAIPEPEMILMTGLGLLLVGFLSHKRNPSK